MRDCPALLLRSAALLLDGTVYLPTPVSQAEEAPSFRLAPGPGGTIQFGHARAFPIGCLIDDEARALIGEQAGGEGGGMAVVAALAEDVARQWRRSREQGLPYETRSDQVMARLRGELAGCDAARLVPDNLLLWYRRAYALMPQQDGRVSVHGRRYEPLAPIPVQGWWSSLQERTAEVVRRHLAPRLTTLAPDPRPLERLRARLADARGRTVTLFEDPPLRITWDAHESVMRFAMAFPGFAQQDAARRWFAFPPGTFSLLGTADLVREFALDPRATRLRTRVEMPSAPDIVHPFVSEMGRELCSAGHVEMIFCEDDLSSAAMVIKALERGIHVLQAGHGSRTPASPYRKLAESRAPRTTRIAAERAGLMVIPWVNAERGRRPVKV